MKDTMPMDETDFKPGSHGVILTNRLGITTKGSIEEAETAALKIAADKLLGIYDAGHRFTDADIRFMHKAWLGGIYAWAGEYRQVNLDKETISYAPAQQAPVL